MKKTLILITVILSSVVAHAGSDYVEPGRHGLQLSVTEDTVFGGYKYVSDKLDLLINFSGHYYTGTNQPYMWPLNAKIGYRFNLGDYNYLAAGARVNFVLFGQDYGNTAANQQVPMNDPSAVPTNLFGMGRYGCYISLQRHFPHSNFIIELNMQPYAYQLNILGDGAGNKRISHDHRWFETGEIGVAYLFGASGDDIKKN
jgi:hypothetical protein